MPLCLLSYLNNHAVCQSAPTEVRSEGENAQASQTTAQNPLTNPDSNNQRLRILSFLSEGGGGGSRLIDPATREHVASLTCWLGAKSQWQTLIYKVVLLMNFRSAEYSVREIGTRVLTSLPV